MPSFPLRNELFLLRYYDPGRLDVASHLNDNDLSVLNSARDSATENCGH